MLAGCFGVGPKVAGEGAAESVRNPDAEDEGSALPVALVGLKNLGTLNIASIAWHLLSVSCPDIWSAAGCSASVRAVLLRCPVPGFAEQSILKYLVCVLQATHASSMRRCSAFGTRQTWR